MFLSGAVKLASGDPTWRDLVCPRLPLRDPAAADDARLVRGSSAAGPCCTSATAATFVVELVLPFLIFAPRNLRRVAAGGFLLLELLIVLTGNYNFFNLLTIVLCLGLLDDRTFGAAAAVSRPSPAIAWRTVVPVMALLGALQIHLTLGRSSVSEWETTLLRVVQPLQIVNNYGLFAVMTTHRDELVIEGSSDGMQWQELPFKFKPQRLDEAPRWATPHQPRLDWQMWFAALTQSRRGAVVRQFRGAIVERRAGRVCVARHVAFAEKPPQLIRVLRYRYQFTTPEQRSADRCMVASSVPGHLVSAGAPGPIGREPTASVAQPDPGKRADSTCCCFERREPSRRRSAASRAALRGCVHLGMRVRREHRCRPSRSATANSATSACRRRGRSLRPRRLVPWPRSCVPASVTERTTPITSFALVSAASSDLQVGKFQNPALYQRQQLIAIGATERLRPRTADRRRGRAGSSRAATA